MLEPEQARGKSWRDRRDVSAHLRLLRLNGNARASLAKRLHAFAADLTLANFEELVAPLFIGIPAPRVADCFHTLSGGAPTIPADVLLDKLFGREEPVYLETSRSATAQLDAVFTERAGADLVHGLARTKGWLTREWREEDQRAMRMFRALDLDAHSMHRALRELHGVQEPVLCPPGASRRVASSSSASHARALGAQAAQARQAPGSAPFAKAASPWVSRGTLVRARVPPGVEFSRAPPLDTLVRRPTPKGPPPLKVVSHRPPTVATMAACMPSRQEALMTAVGNDRRR